MKENFLLRCFLICLAIGLSSCDDSFKEENKIFHGAPESLGIGGLSFGLYKDKRYQIISSGGIGSSEYSGSYNINEDTIILHNLSEELNNKGVFESNRLVVYRYSEQDSTYWQWKYSRLYQNFTTDNAQMPF